MRKLLTVGIALGLLACLSFEAQAKNDKPKKNLKNNRNHDRHRHKGAVKPVLYVLQGPILTDEKVGKVKLNTNAEGILIVNVLLKDGTPDTDFNVTVTINGVAADGGGLSTNRKGKGNAHAEIELDASVYEGDPETVIVSVLVEPDSDPTAGTYATNTVNVPLKPLADEDPE